MDPLLFTRDDAMVTLGVGKNMVQSIRYWCLATGTLEEDLTVRNNRGRQLRPTRLGQLVFLDGGGWDPYLEDIGTLWLLHWQLATNVRRATTWYFAFNHLHLSEFTRSSLEDALSRRYRGLAGVRFTQETLRRDVEVFIRTYVGSKASHGNHNEDSLDCPLRELRLLLEDPAHDLYALVRGPKDSLPDAVLLFAISEYARSKPGQETFTVNELAFEPGSPGQVFKLDQSSLAERLDRAHQITEGAWQFSETLGLRQLFIRKQIDAYALLGKHYSHDAAARQREATVGTRHPAELPVQG